MLKDHGSLRHGSLRDGRTAPSYCVGKPAIKGRLASRFGVHVLGHPGGWREARRRAHHGFVRGACYCRSMIARPAISEGVAPRFRIFQSLVSAERELGLTSIGGWHSELVQLNRRISFAFA